MRTIQGKKKKQDKEFKRTMINMFKNFKQDTDRHQNEVRENGNKASEVWKENKQLNEIQDMKVEFNEQEEILKKAQTEIKLEMKKVNKSNKKLNGKPCQQN